MLTVIKVRGTVLFGQYKRLVIVNLFTLQSYYLSDYDCIVLIIP